VRRSKPLDRTLDPNHTRPPGSACASLPGASLEGARRRTDLTLARFVTRADRGAPVGYDESVRVWDEPGAALIVCVRFGVPVRALALDDRAMAGGLGRAVAYLTAADRPRRHLRTGVARPGHYQGATALPSQS